MSSELDCAPIHGRDKVVRADSQSGGTGFNIWQRLTCPGLTKPAILLRSAGGEKSPYARPWVGEWYRAGVSVMLMGEGVVENG